MVTGGRVRPGLWPKHDQWWPMMNSRVENDRYLTSKIASSQLFTFIHAHSSSSLCIENNLVVFNPQKSRRWVEISALKCPKVKSAIIFPFLTMSKLAKIIEMPIFELQMPFFEFFMPIFKLQMPIFTFSMP